MGLCALAQGPGVYTEHLLSPVPRPRLQETCRILDQSLAPTSEWGWSHLNSVQLMCVARLLAQTQAQLQHCPCPKVVSPGAISHSFSKHSLCVCVTALSSALGLQSGVSTYPCIPRAYILVGVTDNT